MSTKMLIITMRVGRKLGTKIKNSKKRNQRAEQRRFKASIPQAAGNAMSSVNIALQMACENETARCRD